MKPSAKAIEESLPDAVGAFIAWLIDARSGWTVAERRLDGSEQRVPIQPRPLGPQIDWVEHKAPKCMPVGAIRAALLSGQSQVDFILAGGTRIRAKFDEDCPALDFYGGFYLQPQDDRLCAGRDAVHSRIGGSCTIDHFQQLIPKLRR